MLWLLELLLAVLLPLRNARLLRAISLARCSTVVLVVLAPLTQAG